MRRRASAVFDGVPQVLLVSQDHLDSYDAKTGSLLWTEKLERPPARGMRTSPIPGKSGPTASFLSKGYGIGAKLMKVTHDAGPSGKVATVWANRRALKTKFSNVVIKGGSVYGLSESLLECIDLEKGKRPLVRERALRLRPDPRRRRRGSWC